MSPKGVTVDEYLVRKLGFRRAVATETFIFVWAIFEVVEGRPPANIEELAESMARSPKTLYRWQQDFRRAFEGVESPGALVQPLRRALEEKVTPQRVGKVRLSALGVQGG